MTNGRFDGDWQNLGRQLPKIDFRSVRWILLALLVVVAVVGTVYTIEPEEQGVVLRFGAFHPDRVTGPGLHLKIPFGIDTLIRVPVERQLKQEFGFRSTGLSQDQRTQYRQVPDESNMLTGDLNTAEVEWVIQYRIDDPERYLFRVRNVDETLRDLSEAVMREVVGDRTVNEVITIGRTEIELLVYEKLQDLLNRYESGLVVDQVVLQDVNPPDRVKPAFNEVNQAQQELEQKISVAEKKKNEIIPRSLGEAQQMIQEAEGYALDRVNRAEGDAVRFTALFEEYRKAPEVTATRLYLETMEEILPKIGKKVILDSELEGILPLLNLEGAVRPGGAQ